MSICHDQYVSITTLSGFYDNIPLSMNLPLNFLEMYCSIINRTCAAIDYRAQCNA